MIADTADTGSTIRFFISSTFADFQTERTILQERVYQRLRELCDEAGYRLQPIDLRWGVNEAASTERQTLRICFDELERCQTVSPDFFLLILLGDRNGSYILPPEVPTRLAEQLLPHLTPAERDLFVSAYRKDENAVPPEYVLLKSEGPAQAQDEKVRLALARAGHVSGLGVAERLYFEGSATHREIQLGLLSVPRQVERDAGVLCAVRRFTTPPDGPEAQCYVEHDTEGAKQVRILIRELMDRLPKEQMLQYGVAWTNGQPAFDYDALAAAYLELLRPKVEAVIAARVAARAAAGAQGRDVIALVNRAFESDRTAYVEGREVELARLSAYLIDKIDTNLPLVVTGPAGSGKSALLAKAVTRASATQPNTALITRYIGVTPGTSTFLEFLNDLHQTIARITGQPVANSAEDADQLVGLVAAQLATLLMPNEQKLLLVLDGLDQLGAHTQRTDWLPLRLASGVRVVVSLLDDRQELTFLRARLPDEHILTLTPLDSEAGQAMLNDLLAESPRRTLTRSQKHAVLSAFAIQGLPLYLRLLASEARRWRSFDLPQINGAPLPQSILELLQMLLARLEAPERSGRTLVAQTLGDLAVARFGLAEDELLDLLARDEKVREAQRILSPGSPLIAANLPLPVALWARLYAELTPLLTEREDAVGVRLVTFYHQQLRSVVETRYLAGTERMERHQALANYFADLPWRWGTAVWNWRKVEELVTQQEGAGSQEAAEQSLLGLADELEQAPRTQVDDSLAIVALIQQLSIQLHSRYWRVGERLYQESLADFRRVIGPIGEAMALQTLGDLVRRQGRLDEAAHMFERALEIARQTGERTAEGNILGNLGLLAMNNGENEDAEPYYEQALTIAQQIGDRTSEGNHLSNLGVLAFRQGRLEEAARYYEVALLIHRETGNRAGEILLLHSLGALAIPLGRAAVAARFYERALAIAREIGDRAEEGRILRGVGLLMEQVGRRREARLYYEQALAIAREIGDRMSEGSILHNLGWWAANRRIFEEAKLYYAQALALRREVNNRAGEITTLNNIGMLAGFQGQFAEATRYCEQALTIAREIGDRAAEVQSLSNLGSLTHRQKRFEEAERYYKQALGVARDVGDRASEIRWLYTLAMLASRQKRRDETRRYLEEAYTARQSVETLAGSPSRRRGCWPFVRHGR